MATDYYLATEPFITAGKATAVCRSNSGDRYRPMSANRSRFPTNAVAPFSSCRPTYPSLSLGLPVHSLSSPVQTLMAIRADEAAHRDGYVCRISSIDTNIVFLLLSTFHSFTANISIGCNNSGCVAVNIGASAAVGSMSRSNQSKEYARTPSIWPWFASADFMLCRLSTARSLS